MAVLGICAFCTRYRKLTDEDIFARWMKSVIHRSGYEKHTRGTVRFVRDKTGNLVPLQVTYKKPGHAASLKVPCVCSDCNNQWMSNLENQNKAVLTALIEGKQMLLFPSQMKKLATWVAKTVMAGEFYDRAKIAIPQDQRTWLMGNLTPPNEGWSIWIGPYDGPQWAVELAHQTVHLPPADPSKRIPGDDTLNTQSTAMILGHLAIYVISTVSEGYPFFTLRGENLNRSDWRRIWPVPTTFEVWPRGRLLGKDDLVRIVNSFSHAIGAPPTLLF
jgi:hypothetical protein